MTAIRRLLGLLLAPVGLLMGYAGCLRCHATWMVAKEHSTSYSSGGACFPLCESCWQSLSAEDRLPYYEKLVLTMWETEANRAKWPEVKQAVLAGK